MERLTEIGSTDELLSWFFESRERLDLLANRKAKEIALLTNIPEKLIVNIIYSRSFVQAVFDELHFRHLNPSTLTEIYDVILAQLKSPDVPLGAKRSVLEFMVRQMGLEKPRKLSVKQQNEVVVRVEPIRPVQVMEALGVSVEQDALPEATDVPFEPVEGRFDEPELVPGEPERAE